MGRKLPFGSDVGQRQVSVLQVAIAFAVSRDRWWDRPLEVAVLHGLTMGMYESGLLFDRAADVAQNYAEHFAVVGGDGRKAGGQIPRESWIGSDAVIEQLVRRGVEKDQIIITGPIEHSKHEAVEILKMARERRFKRVGSISVAYHGIRMLPYMVAAMKESAAAGEPYWIDYRMVSFSTDWWHPMLGSQGAMMSTPFLSAMDDALKIEQHIKSGFAASFEEVAYYLCNRESIVESQTWDYPGTDTV